MTAVVVVIVVVDRLNNEKHETSPLKQEHKRSGSSGSGMELAVVRADGMVF